MVTDNRCSFDGPARTARQRLDPAPGPGAWAGLPLSRPGRRRARLEERPQGNVPEDAVRRGVVLLPVEVDTAGQQARLTEEGEGDHLVPELVVDLAVDRPSG